MGHDSTKTRKLNRKLKPVKRGLVLLIFLLLQVCLLNGQASPATPIQPVLAYGAIIAYNQQLIKSWPPYSGGLSLSAFMQAI
jgi:hypothetical protein